MEKSKFLAVYTAVCVGIGLIIGVIVYSVIITHQITAYKAYYNAAERVLDETYEVYDSFLDTVGEGDAYLDYINAYKALGE